MESRYSAISVGIAQKNAGSRRQPGVQAIKIVHLCANSMLTCPAICCKAYESGYRSMVPTKVTTNKEKAA